VEYIASLFKVEEYAEEGNSVKAGGNGNLHSVTIKLCVLEDVEQSQQQLRSMSLRAN
jgi:hypothetical protein